MSGKMEPMGDQLARWLEGEGGAVLDAILREAPDIVGVADRDLRFRYLNWTGPSQSRDELIGTSAVAVVPPAYRDRVRAAYLSVLETGAKQQLELIFGEGEAIRIWDVHCGPIRHEGEIIGIVSVSIEVAEERRAAADRDRFFFLSLDMLVVVSADGRFKRVNPAFAVTLGYDESRLEGTPFEDFVHRDDRAATMDAFARVLGGMPVTDFENRYRRADGSHRVFSWRATVDPVTKDVYAVARDVTDHRALETQLRHSQKMEAIGQLAGGVAHDFNNLMQAVLANTELATTLADPSPDVAEHLAEIESAGRRAADLTRQLLAFSRRQPLRIVRVDLNKLTRGLMKMLRRLLPEHIAIDFIPGHSLASVNADPSQLEQVIVNLCVNARDAMPTGGQITIETENVLINGRYRETHPWATPGRYVLMSVTDTGVGMTPEIRDRVFEPFFTTKVHHEGTGLGLSTVYGIVRQHGGMVLVYSEPGVGTTFKVYLVADSRFASDVGDKIERLPPTGDETILLSEDESSVRRVAITILERAGYRVIATKNGREAIQYLRNTDERVDLALLDVVMPELGGPETWEQLRKLRPDIRVLFSSGYADDRYRDRLPDDAELLKKPFRVEDLLHRIRAKLDE
jgi:PAS domain S-box-containing protein